MALRHWQSVQALRAVAAVLVVAYHAVELWRAGHPRIGSWSNGAAGVDLFFIISGFVMIVASARLAERPDGGRVFLRRRLERVVPLYWLATTAKLALVVVAPALAHHARPGWTGILCSYLFLPSHDAEGLVRPLLPVGWTLWFEMMFYLVFAAGLALRPPDGLRGVATRVVLPTLGCIAAASLFRRPGWPAIGALASPLTLEFAAGVLLGLAASRAPATPPSDRALAAASCLAVVSLLALVALPAGTPWWRTLDWGGPAAVLVAASLVIERADRLHWPRWLLRLGDASYAIYLAHGFVLAGLGTLHLASLPTLLTAALVLSVAAGLIAHHAIEQPLAAWFAGSREAGVTAQASKARSPASGLRSRRAVRTHLFK